MTERRDLSKLDVDAELMFCSHVGEALYKKVIEETGGDAPRVILSTAILLVALSENKKGVMEAILSATKLVDAKVEYAKQMLMEEASASPLN